MTLAGMLPHQVEILYDFEGAGNGTVCAGTIISSWLVLTVATCLAGRNESLFKIRANGKNQNEGQIRSIDEVHSYAALNSDPSPFDVALIRLNSELELDENHTSKIRYDRNQVVLDLDSFPKEDSYCYEPGVSQVRTVELSECSETLEGKEGDKFMCTEAVENIGGSFHQLPGSSLICSGILYGLFSMSWSNHGEIPEERVYTSVAAYSRWIRFALDPREADDEEENDFLPEVDDSLFGRDVLKVSDPVPYQLSIRFNGRHNCGGVILDKKTALSAAHCFESRNNNHYRVVAGEKNLYKTDSTEQILQIEKLFVHPNYKGVFGGNDIAVIQIKGEFNFTERVNSVRISSPSNRIRSLQEFRGTTLGWGRTSTSEEFSPFLLSLELSFMCRSRCKRKWGFYKDSMICGYSYSSNTCKGDSGGPLVIKYLDDGPHTKKDLLVGLLSFGPNNCQQTDAPSGFTNVPYFYRWIAEKRSNSLCSSAQFQCFNGECIHQDLKCDKKFDCEDGSDEKMCSSSIRVTGLNDTFCGTTAVGRTEIPGPYELSIRLNGSHVCGGVILDKMTALSAAHCFDEEPYEQLYTLAVVGEQNLNENGTKEILQIQKVFVHPNYTDFLSGNDIAVIRVQGDFSFSKRVNHIWISSQQTPTFRDRLDFLGVATGLDKTGANGQFSPAGQSLKLEYMNRGQCKKGWHVLKGSTLCGYSDSSDMCGRDSGGPLVIKNFERRLLVKKDLLVGIISFGPNRCQEKGQPSGFTNVKLFYDWIAEKRSNSLALPSKFQCFNGEYIHKDQQCDYKSDCWDGSDEKMCESHSRVSAPCGGFINLAERPRHVIVYRVPSEEPQRQRGRDSTCLWIISTGRQDSRASIEATILDDPSAQFNPNSDVIFASYRFTMEDSRSFIIDEVETKYKIPGPFMTVYYRTDSSAPNAGFHLTLKDSITKSNIKSRLDVKMITIPNANLKEGETREFSYPSKSSSGSSVGVSNSNSKYLSNERTFFILKPQKPGTKVRVNLTFVDTEENYDWLHISTLRALESIYVTGLTGRSNWTDNILDGLEDEPIFFYFHSNEAIEGRGFKMEYSEIPAPKPSSCGGFILVEGEQEIVYKVPEELQGEKSVCVWVIAAAGARQMEYEVLSNPRAYFEPPESTLFAIYDFTPNGFSNTNMLDKDETLTIDQPVLVLYFRTSSSAPNSGFHIHFKEVGEREAQEAVKYLELPPSPKPSTDGATRKFQFTQPPTFNHENNERTFIIVKPTSWHGKLRLDLKSVDTKEDEDWMEILSVNSQPTSEFRFSGADSWLDKSFEAEEDEPFIIHFHSEESTTESGFQLFYSEQKDPESVTTSCGGFINLNRRHEIIYKVPSEENQRERDSICLWIVSTGRKDAGASIQATILNNPSAQFNPTSDIIFANHNFTTNIEYGQFTSDEEDEETQPVQQIPHYKIIDEVETKYKIPGPFMTVYYRTTSSAPNAGFHLKLKDTITQSNIKSRLDVKMIPIPNANLKEGETREFSYPSKSSSGSSVGVSNSNSKYLRNERTFFILKPQKSGGKIRINLTFVGTQEIYDWLQILSCQVRPTVLTRFDGRSNWTENILEGWEDEPLFIYFHSDGSNQRGGFKMQYSEIMMPKPSPCGGLVLLEGEQEIVYKVPGELRGGKSVCLWVVAAAGGSHIETEILNNPRAHFQPEDSTLYALYDFKINHTSHWNMWRKDRRWTIDQPFLVLYFRTNSSAPNSGFHIHLKEVGKKEMQKAVKYLELPPPTTTADGTVQEFKYPLPPASNYANDERTFIILKPVNRHGKLKLDLKSVDTEENSDWMEILSVKAESTSEFRFSGEGSWSDQSFEAEEDEPFIIYFHSHENSTGSGFQFSYSEQRKFTN